MTKLYTYIELPDNSFVERVTREEVLDSLHRNYELDELPDEVREVAHRLLHSYASVMAIFVTLRRLKQVITV